jgi:hypothetical protein
VEVQSLLHLRPKLGDLLLKDVEALLEGFFGLGAEVVLNLFGQVDVEVRVLATGKKEKFIFTL